MQQFDVSLDQNRDHSKKTVMLITETIYGGFVGISDRRPSFSFQADNELTPSRILKALYQLEPFTR